MSRGYRPWIIDILIINENMQTDRYESPTIEILKMQAEQAIFVTSLTGEGINEWEDM